MATKEKTILVVEDDFLNRRLSKKVLTENGFRVMEAKNSNEALELLRKESIDLVILDINLGEEEQDGIGLGHEIHDHHKIPFIYLTAYETTEIIDRAVATAPYSYLTKPFKNIDLIASVEVAIRQSASRVKHELTIQVKDEDYNVELVINEIDYIESDGNYLLFHTDGKTYRSRSTIKHIMETLPASTFIQTHRAFVVNKNKIEKYSAKSLIIKEAVIPVSKTYFDTQS